MPGPAQPFNKDQSGNPKGRPKGSRHKLTEDFVTKLAADFAKHGKGAIAVARETDPAAYCRLIASLAPKDINL